MKYRTRTFYSDAQKAMMWDRWRQGESLHEIARSFDRHHGSVRGILAQTGGFRPPQRVRSSRVLSLSEREEISRGVVAGSSMRTMASSSGRAPSSISREIGRNGGRQAYRASEADASAWQRARSTPAGSKLKPQSSSVGVEIFVARGCTSRLQLALPAS
jgi:Helix-turn-helix domain